MRPDSATESNGDFTGLDPISQQIFERTHTPFKPSPSTAHSTSGAPDDQFIRQLSNSEGLKRHDSISSSKDKKEKQKGVSFLSRIIGSRKKEKSGPTPDTASEISENRSNWDTETLSQPVGYIPRFPAPVKYVKVKTQHRRQKDFDRLFLAQNLLREQVEKEKKADVDSKIHHIDAEIPAEAPKPASPASKAVWASEFSKDGRYLAAGGQDKKLRIWEVVTNNEDRGSDDAVSDASNDADEMKLRAPVFKTKLVREYEGHTSAILDLSWSKNNFVLSSSMDKTVRLYHVSRPECLCSFKHNDFVTSIQFHPRDDRFFLAGSLDAKLRLWSIPDKTVAYWTQVPDMVTAVAFTPDGKTSIAGTLSGVCILYETEGLKAHSQIQVRSNRGKNSKGSKITGIDTISMQRFQGLQEVKLLITSNDSRVRMYNLRDRNLEVKFRGNENSCSQIRATFSDDGRYVICGSEDRKVYIWPTNPAERPEGEKRPMEVFEAHQSIVTTALMAPAHTRRLLGQSGDPIYDLCNPPPVTLLARQDSVISSKTTPTEQDDKNENPQPDGRMSEDAPSKRSSGRAPETPAYLARHAHVGGHIIVTADYSGEVKIFRQDCAYQKRRNESWDPGFSRKMLGRSGSVNTKGSSGHRSSINMGSKNHSNDRILNWRNSVSNGNGNSAANSTSELTNHRGSMFEGKDGQRNSSPRRSAFHPLRNQASEAHSNSVSSPQSLGAAASTTNAATSQSHQPSTPRISIQGPETPENKSEIYHSAEDNANHPAHPNAKVGESQATKPKPHGDARTNFNPDDTAYDVRDLNTNPTGADLPHKPGDALYLIGDQSYASWNLESTLKPMINHEPRSPGPSTNPAYNGLSRSTSDVSQLSQLSSEIATPMSGDYLSASRRGSGGRPGILGRFGSRSEQSLSATLSRGLSSSKSDDTRSEHRSSGAGGFAAKTMKKLRGRKSDVSTGDMGVGESSGGAGASASAGSSGGATAGHKNSMGPEDLKCSTCRNTSFKATVNKKGQHVLTCTKCGNNM